MKKIKLPRKRKKAFKKSKQKTTYLAMRILGEILVEEGNKYGARFYELRMKKRGEKGFEPFNNGHIVVKRW